MRVKFFLEEIDDNPYVRDNFKRLQDAIDTEAVLKPEFKFFQITVTSGVTSFSYPHKLKYQPKDVIFLSASNNADVTFKYDSFTATNIVFTTTAACTFRCFIGTYREGDLK